MYALIETGGQQFKVQEGDLLKVEKLAGGVGDKVELDKVMMIRGESDTKIGAPYLAGAKVIGEIVAQGKARKVVIFKYRRRKGFQKKRGHRQPFTQLKIAQILG
ncbi:MAG: 50S ribosomal protein L21 [Myxococcales bacterium]|nr:50S ribosomal protein L21 [Myxococcales bacterium]